MKSLNREHLESLIADTQYQRFGETMTVCALTLKNGYVVIGQSACISKEIFDEEQGRRIAYENAVSKMWELEGYHAKSTIYADLMLSGG